MRRSTSRVARLHRLHRAARSPKGSARGLCPSTSCDLTWGVGNASPASMVRAGRASPMSQPKNPQRFDERLDSRGSKGPYLIYSVVEQLGRDIVVGEYGEASPFRGEAELAAKIGVGRSVLREAVKILGAKGLLSGRPRHGTWVQSEEHWNLLDPDVLRW